MSAFSVENLHDGKTFENYTRFEWGVEVGVVTTFMLRLFVPHEFDMHLVTCTKRNYREPYDCSRSTLDKICEIYTYRIYLDTSRSWL